jgi:Taurine catabolism dioxygenase TauD, TfdA family
LELGRLIDELAVSPKTWDAEGLAKCRAVWQAEWSSDMGSEEFIASQSLPRRLMDQAVESVRNGPGLFLLRGLPVRELGAQGCEALIRGVGCSFGDLAPMDADGSLVHRVAAIESAGIQRGYQTRGALALHNDACDFIVFLALRSSRGGGERKVASALTALRSVYSRSPHLVRRLLEPIKMPRYFNGIDATHIHELPLLGFVDSAPLFVVKPGYVRYLARNGVQPFRDEEHEQAYNVFVDELNNEANSFCWGVQEGDVEIYDNFRILHARNGYEDGDDESQRRALLRVWVADSSGAPLPRAFACADDYRHLCDARKVEPTAALKTKATEIL